MYDVNTRKCSSMIGALALIGLAGVRPALAQWNVPATSAVFDAVEPVSGTRLMLQRAPGGETRLVVSHPMARIVRHLERRGSRTIIEVGTGRLTLAYSRHVVAVEGLGSRLTLTPGDRWAAEELRRRLAESALTNAAIRVLTAVQVEPGSPLGGILASTRFLLRSMSGHADAVRDLIQVRRALGGRLQLVTAGFATGSCWDEYVRDGIAAWEAFMECRNSGLAWVPGYLQFCDFNYDVQAVTALAAYVGCLLAA